MKRLIKFSGKFLPLAVISLVIILAACSGGGAGKVTICHATGSESNPYEEITVDANGLNGHDQHEGDIIPMPANGCPTTQAEIQDGKITICHATSSKKNPYNEITIDTNGLNGHGDHEGDIIPAPAGGCPGSK